MAKPLPDLVALDDIITSVIIVRITVYDAYGPAFLRRAAIAYSGWTGKAYRNCGFGPEIRAFAEREQDAFRPIPVIESWEWDGSAAHGLIDRVWYVQPIGSVWRQLNI